MRFCKTLAIVAVVALAMVGAKAAKADGGDPKVHIVAPTDPVLEPCSDFEGQNITCFTSNTESDPLVVTGPTLAQLEGPGYDFLTNFIYEPDDSICNPTSCPDPAADAIKNLWIAIVPTISAPLASYTCDIGVPPAGQETAFNQCPAAAATNQTTGIQYIDVACNLQLGACTGLLPGEAGSAEIAPEPGEMAMLGLGIALVGFCGWKRRQAIEANGTNQQNLATS
jgi:hypothetical protein